MTAILPVHARLVDGQLLAYDLSQTPAATGLLSPDAAFDVSGETARIEGHTVRRDLSRAVYATPDAVVCMDRDGQARWRREFGPQQAGPVNARASCEFSLDGRLVWVYRPDGMAGRGNGLDRWLVLDADTGAVRSDVELQSVGHGGEHFPHPDGVHMLLDVGEGQDGSRVFRGRFTETGVELTDYPWEDRVVVGLAPDGRHLMTVQQEQEDVAFHTWPDGEEVVRIPVAAFGQEWPEAMVEWAGGYLDPDTAVVTIVGEDEETEEEWHRHHLVDVRTGEIRGVLDAPTRNSYDLEPLGDGTFLRTDGEGRPWRHRPGEA